MISKEKLKSYAVDFFIILGISYLLAEIVHLFFPVKPHPLAIAIGVLTGNWISNRITGGPSKSRRRDQDS